MEVELTQLVVQVYRILVLVGFLGGVIRLAYNYIEQCLGKEDAFIEGAKNVLAATIWVILVPTVLWIVISGANLVRFQIGIEQIVETLGRATRQ